MMEEDTIGEPRLVFYLTDLKDEKAIQETNEIKKVTRQMFRLVSTELENPAHLMSKSLKALKPGIFKQIKDKSHYNCEPKLSSEILPFSHQNGDEAIHHTDRHVVVYDNEMKGNIVACQMSSEVLQGLIANTADYATVIGGKFKVKNELVNVRNLVQHAFEITASDLFESREKLNQIKLIWNVQKNVPATITSDSCRIRQVLIALLRHSVKSTERGLVRCFVRHGTTTTSLMLPA